MIPLIEKAGKSILFLRPRRFGKSLVLSMLENYYDIAKKDQFEDLFGHLNIGKNPTSLHNSFFILKLDFSCIGAFGTPQELQMFIPEDLMDENLAVDTQKINYISKLPIGETIVTELGQKNTCIEIEKLKARFGIEDLLLDHSKDRQFIASYLYYVGALTMSGVTKTGKTALRIPNLLMKSLYIDRIMEILLPDPAIRDKGKMAAEQLYTRGNIQPLCDFIVTHYFKILSNRDYAWANELTVKIAFLTLLYNDSLYIMDSETEINRRYTDLTMIIRPDKRQFEIYDILIEFKYISLKEAELTGEVARKMDQIELYEMQCIKSNMESAIQQARQYEKALNQKYTELRLKSFAVVALGFDRISWKFLEHEC